MYRSNIRKNSRNEEETTITVIFINNRSQHAQSCVPTGTQEGTQALTDTQTHMQLSGLLEGGGGFAPRPAKHPASPRPPALRQVLPGYSPHPRQCGPLGGGCRGQLLPWSCVPAPCREEPAPYPPPMGAGEEQGRQELPAVQADRAHTGSHRNGRCWGPATHPRTCPLPSHGLAGTWLSSAVQRSDGARASGKAAQPQYRGSASATVAQEAGKQGWGELSSRVLSLPRGPCSSWATTSTSVGSASTPSPSSIACS